jgi:hypothetical protein
VANMEIRRREAISVKDAILNTNRFFGLEWCAL